VLDNLGLATALGDAGTQFAERTGVSVKVACVKLTAQLPADTELALYRILQEALRNVEKHASASHVTVRVSQLARFVRLVISDDGIGFEPGTNGQKSRGRGGLGLLSMRERASYVGATCKVKSSFGTGTEIEIVIPISPGAPAAG